MDFKLSVDTKSIEDIAKTKMKQDMQAAIMKSISSFFSTESLLVFNLETRSHERAQKKGDGLKQIEEFIEDKFLDSKFQESMEKYFDHHWEEIFKACMVRALQHKANGIAFNRIHDLTLNSEKK